MTECAVTWPSTRTQTRRQPSPRGAGVARVAGVRPAVDHRSSRAAPVLHRRPRLARAAPDTPPTMGHWLTILLQLTLGISLRPLRPPNEDGRCCQGPVKVASDPRPQLQILTRPQRITIGSTCCLISPSGFQNQTTRDQCRAKGEVIG